MEPRQSLAQELCSFRSAASGLSAARHANADPTAELGALFPTLPGGTKRKKVSPWKRPLFCLSSPLDMHIPSRATQNKMAAVGLGPLWMSGENPAEVPASLTSEEFHSLVVSMFPALKATPYELCKAGGANHTTVVPLELPSTYSHLPVVSFCHTGTHTA